MNDEKENQSFFDVHALGQCSGPTCIAYSDIAVCSCIVCSYGGEWWIGVVMGEGKDSSDCLASFHWSQKDDICWVKVESILKVIKNLQNSWCS
jgi:hypothetical protein